MGSDQPNRQMIEDITRVGVRAAVLLRGVVLQTVDRDTLEWGLRELAAGRLLERYFGYLVDHPECVDLLNLLHLVYSLEGQLEFQVREYGLDSVKDDLEEINFSLRRVGERFDLAALRQAV
ncbi:MULTISPECIES: hypothetical protein [Deferrisoma]|nr:MAG: hypothetical protein D6708_13450 [Candidatus Dadabacteria bacterium]